MKGVGDMSSRRARIGVVLGLLGLVGTTAPPAQATIVSKTTAIVTFTLGAPIGYPCLPECPTVPTTHGSLPLPTGPVQFHTHPGGPTRPIVGVATVACTNNVQNINKPGKAPLHVGACNLALAPGKPPEGNHYHGWCGLGGGQVQLIFTDALGQAFHLDIHFTVVDGIVFLEGHWRKLNNAINQTGLVVGIALAVAVPGIPAGNSCANNTANVFTLVVDGEAVGV